MISATVYQHIVASKQNQKKLFAVLIDPDKVDMKLTRNTARLAKNAKADLFLVGGSLMTKYHMAQTIECIKQESDAPVVLFPGSPLQLTDAADALLFLSLISGRNADLLIGQHVTAAPILKNMDLEVMPTGYMIVDGGTPTTASYISNTHPVPHDKSAIAACTAMAGELLGLRLLYMDTGSGAKKSVSVEMVERVRQVVDLPIIVGGGIRHPETAFELCQAGADMIVVGTAIEENPEVMFQMADAVHSAVSPL